MQQLCVCVDGRPCFAKNWRPTSLVTCYSIECSCVCVCFEWRLKIANTNWNTTCSHSTATNSGSPSSKSLFIHSSFITTTTTNKNQLRQQYFIIALPIQSASLHWLHSLSVCIPFQSLISPHQQLLHIQNSTTHWNTWMSLKVCS